MSRPRTRIGDVLRCSKCGLDKPALAFRIRTSGRPMPWCINCKRIYDNAAGREKRRNKHHRALILRHSPANPYWWGIQRSLWGYHITVNGVHY